VPLRQPPAGYPGRAAGRSGNGRHMDGGVQPMTGTGPSLTRRRFLQAAGSLIVSFKLADILGTGRAAAAPLPVSQFDVDRQLELAPGVDAWLRVDADGSVTFFTGKVEIGNGLMTALTQIVAEELDVPFERVKAVAGDTDLVPDQ